MCLVHDQQVPVTLQRLLMALRVVTQKFQRTQRPLLAMKRIALFRRRDGFVIGVTGDDAVKKGFKAVIRCGGHAFNIGAPCFIENRKMQIEAAQHFHQPLVDQRFRYHDQHTAGALGEQLLMQNQSGLDGLAQSDLIGQQHTGRITACHFTGDVKLVREQAGAGTGQTIQI